MTNKASDETGRKTQTEAIEKQRAEFNGKLGELDTRAGELDKREGAVDSEAVELTEKIKALAEEHKRLDQRKKDLERRAREIGDRRTGIAAERKRLTRERDALIEGVRGLDSRREEIDRQQAYDETQKVASFQVQAPPDAAKVDTQASPGDGTTEANQRTRPRLSVQVDVSLHTEHNFYAGLTDNISEGGLFIATHENLPLGTQMNLTLSLPDHEPFEVEGEVRWLREYNDFTSDVSPGVGVAFNDLPDARRALIEQFIRQRSPLLYEAM
ncbi:MAG TPA: TIGR02266 family protein [Myxococcota bacterium]|nr:TIGR02266 family protein [Myxococcota bacterium]